MPGPRIAVVVKGYPRLSETFIAQEILALQQRGLGLTIISLRHPTDRARHDLHQEIKAPVLYLPEYLYQEPARVARAWHKVRSWPTYRGARSLWRRDLARDRTANRVRRFGQALVLAAEMPDEVGFIYAHYLHTPGSVARYAAHLTGLPFALSAHAKDIWITPDWEKREKLADCRWVTTCTRLGAEHLQGLAPAADVFLTYHGLDARRFTDPGREMGPDGSDPKRPVRLLGVARLVPKKGLDVLLQALASLPPGAHWRYDHIGGGPLVEALAAQAAQLGLAPRIRWLGARTRAEVLDACRAADLFVLASRIAPDGDRDGLPNVLLEAGSQELALVASDVAGVPEFIRDGVNGRLVPPEDPQALARALHELITAPQARLRLGRAARATVLASFDMERSADRLAARLRAEAGRSARAAA